MFKFSIETDNPEIENLFTDFLERALGVQIEPVDEMARGGGGGTASFIKIPYEGPPVVTVGEDKTGLGGAMTYGDALGVTPPPPEIDFTDFDMRTAQLRVVSKYNEKLNELYYSGNLFTVIDIVGFPDPNKNNEKIRKREYMAMSNFLQSKRGKKFFDMERVSPRRIVYRRADKV